VGFAACSESTPPDTDALSGRYELVSVNGTELPLVVFTGIDGSSRLLVAGSLDFRTRGRFIDVRTIQDRSPTGVLGAMYDDSAAFAYRLVDDTLLVQHPMPFEPDSYVDTGTVNGTLLSLDARARLTRDGLSAIGGQMVYFRTP
jgi:hypothetical protein